MKGHRALGVAAIAIVAAILLIGVWSATNHTVEVGSKTAGEVHRHSSPVPPTATLEVAPHLWYTKVGFPPKWLRVRQIHPFDLEIMSQREDGAFYGFNLVREEGSWTAIYFFAAVVDGTYHWELREVQIPVDGIIEVWNGQLGKSERATIQLLEDGIGFLQGGAFGMTANLSIHDKVLTSDPLRIEYAVGTQNDSTDEGGGVQALKYAIVSTSDQAATILELPRNNCGYPWQVFACKNMGKWYVPEGAATPVPFP